MDDTKACHHEFMKSADIQKDITKVLITHTQIDQRLDQLAAQIDHDYAGDDQLLLISVLKGAVNTLVWLTEKMHIPAPIDFMSLSTYGSGTNSTGTVTVRSDLSTDVKGRDILIVEDIVDTGYTLNWLVDLLKKRGARSVKIMALLSKPARRTHPVDISYLGFEIPNDFIVGCGMDYNEKYRNLDCVAVLSPSVYQKK
jgi:hypoxanthine phosphoribosyltransferase